MPLKNQWRKLVFFDELASLVAPIFEGRFGANELAISQRALAALTDNPRAETAYTLPANAADLFTRFTASGAVTLTVPPTTTATIPLMQPVPIARWGSGIVTITQGAGVTILPANNLRLATLYDVATLMRITANTWLLKGEAVT